MWTRSELKETGKAAFKDNYWRCVLVALILGMLTAGSSLTGQTGSIKNFDASKYNNETLIAISAFAAAFIIIFTVTWILLRIFLLNPLEVGCHVFFKDNISGQPTLNSLAVAFRDYKRSAITILLRDVFLALWFCLIIPGFIKVYSYRMVPLILADEPDLSPSEVITRSREMMNGHKWKAALLDLSFLGWILLSLLTCGIVGVFYVNPYKRSTDAALYLKLKEIQAAEQVSAE